MDHLVIPSGDFLGDDINRSNSHLLDPQEQHENEVFQFIDPAETAMAVATIVTSESDDEDMRSEPQVPPAPLPEEEEETEFVADDHGDSVPGDPGDLMPAAPTRSSSSEYLELRLTSTSVDSPNDREESSSNLRVQSAEEKVYLGEQANAIKRKSSSKEEDISELPGLLPLQLGAAVNPLEGYIYTLDAPTSGVVRIGEDSLTYLNKDQFYKLTLEFTPSVTLAYPVGTVSSMIMLQFRERKKPEEARANWEFWQTSQSSLRLRLIDIDPKESTEIIGEPNEIAHNAVVVTWNPSTGPASVMVAVRCLSTDFSLQKGVKGIPLHIQIDTYESGKGSIVCDRGFCQIKTFCDKGAERKAREEERRVSKHQVPSSAMVTHPHSIFQKALDLVTEPSLYNPKDALPSLKKALPVVTQKQKLLKTKLRVNRRQTKKYKNKPDQLKKHREIQPASTVIPPLKLTATNCGISKLCQQQHPTPPNRILVYARQENEEVYTPLHIIWGVGEVHEPLQGLINAISDKYQIDCSDIRYLFRQNHEGNVVNIDDDTIKQYWRNEISFIMKVLETEDTVSGSVVYDVAFIETFPLSQFGNIQGSRESTNVMTP